MKYFRAYNTSLKMKETSLVTDQGTPNTNLYISELHNSVIRRSTQMHAMLPKGDTQICSVNSPLEYDKKERMRSISNAYNVEYFKHFRTASAKYGAAHLQPDDRVKVRRQHIDDLIEQLRVLVRVRVATR